MYIACDKEKKIYNALDGSIEKAKDYVCPICGGKVIYKQGMKIQSHFAHAKNCNCQYDNYKKESEEHLNTKKKLYEHFKKMYRTVEVEHFFKANNSIQIADVYIKDREVAFEYQRSVIPFEIIKERTIGYEKAGIKPIWLIDTKKFIKELSFHDDIIYIKYSPFVDNFLNYYQGKVFFYGWNNDDEVFEFYQIWSHDLKKHTAVCKKTIFSVDDFDIPLDLSLATNDLSTKIYPKDVEDYVRTLLSYDAGTKNKILSMLYNQHITHDNIPKLIGVNMTEQLLISTPLIYWQGMIYRFFNEGKTYGELLRIMSNIIEFKDSIYINNVQQGEIFLKVFKNYYNILVKNGVN